MDISKIMFKVSTKGDYGLVLLSALAESASREFLSLSAVAKAKHLSVQYLSQIVLPLKEAGIVESKEGKRGGYRLAKGPSEITLMEVLEVLEGGIKPVPCCDGTGETECERAGNCSIEDVWRDASDLMRHFLENKRIKK